MVNGKKNRKFNKRIIWFSFVLAFGLASVLCLLFGVSFVKPAFAGGASLYLSPSTGTFFIGSTFDISIFVNTGGNNVNAVKVDLKFDSGKIQIASPTAGKSFIEVWVAQPAYSNIKGTASFQGGVPSPGINTSSGLVSTITFRAIAPGKAAISISDSSQVLLDDGMGTDILSSSSRGEYQLVIPPPEGPKVFSTTHPDQNRWYRNNNPSFGWEKEGGVTDFSYSIDHSSYGTPDNISEGDQTSVSYSDLEDGVWYFHVKAEKAGVWGGVSHYLVQIDSTPPADFTIEVDPIFGAGTLTSQRPWISFITTDALSGLDHYEIKTVNLTRPQEERIGFFLEASSPYQLPLTEPGEYEVVVRAFDVAGNWRDVSRKIEIISAGKPFYVTKGGVNIFGIFLKWWQAGLVLLVLIGGILFLVFRWRRNRIYLEEKRESLEKTRKKAEKEREETEKKLKEVKKS